MIAANLRRNTLLISAFAAGLGAQVLLTSATSNGPAGFLVGALLLLGILLAGITLTRPPLRTYR